MRFILVCAVAALASSSFAQSDATDKWGTLSGRITFTGTAPDIEELKTQEKLKLPRLARDKPAFVDDSLVVNSKNRGLANAVVWLTRRGNEEVPVHPDFAKTADSIRSMFSGEKRLAPHIMTIRAGQTLRIDNSRQQRAACLMTPFLNNEAVNPLIKPGETYDVQMKKTERLPTRLSGSILPWLSAYVLVMDHPYMAVTDKNGRFEMRSVPVGEWEFRFWHERFGYFRDVTLNGSETELPKGLRKIIIKSGSNDIGKTELAERKPSKTKPVFK